MDDWGSIPDRGNFGTFNFRHSFQTGSGATQPPVQWAPEAFMLQVKRSGREATIHLHIVPT
jgi:hypothetical protein